MADFELSEGLRNDLRTAWHRYVDTLVPLRPALYGYCRRLTGNVWDAEDLVQDTLLRAFAHWGVTYPPIRDPRAYLLRTATNVWIDTLRRRQTEARPSLADLDGAPAPGPNPETSSDVREAGSRLLQRLSPQERAAVVLKEVFEMSLEEIAELLATTTQPALVATGRKVDISAVRWPVLGPIHGEGLVREFIVAGMDSCESASALGDIRYHAAQGALRTKVNCIRKAFTMREPVTIRWELRYRTH